MLKTRIMPTLLLKGVGLVKGVGFDSSRRVGAAMQAVKVYNMREVDELVLLDISATAQSRRPDLQQIEELAAECFMPLTVGGGVQCIGDIRGLLSVGADKVAINSASVDNPNIIAEGTARFGAQCIIVSIDARRTDRGYEVFTHSGRKATGIDPADHARRMRDLGAGEILITSIDRDGTMQGYDLELVRRVADAVDIPVIASGGAGSYAHMVEALREGRASAIAAASIFHFTEQTPREAKRYLHEHGISVRLPQ